MQFIKISSNTECSCLNDSYADLTNMFVRKVRKAPDMKDADFKNHFERDKTPEKNTCDEICGFHGVSIEIWNDSSSKALLEKYLYTAGISPKHKNNLSVFKLKENAGLVKHTPHQVEFNEYHYDFYKEDSFTVDRLELIEMIPIIPNQDA
ncbi:hypothetical protein D1631_17170 [Chryseobacterium nematophagum]|uniref:Uncharacterized protein n=2 Tax=Chryseobacterium nematophagum TaxID=2305228 RepID=A0A3M7TJR6_9FLAO|nr:hypothetical protein D1631_17170 [Chryseobacterium nematophagum]